MYIFRDYQELGINKALDFIKNKKDKSKPILVYPTGTGKSLIIAGIANGVDTPMLILQPNKELLIQNYNKYISYGNEASIFSASMNSKEVGHVTFATPLSVANAPHLFKGIKLIIIDEAHLQSNPSGTLGKFLKKFKTTKLIGLTASPVVLLSNGDMGPHLKLLTRTRKSLWNKFLHVSQIAEIKDKYWCKMEYSTLKLDNRKLKWNSSQSEYTEQSISDYYSDNNLENKIVEKVKTLNDKKAILIFVPSISDAENLHRKIPESALITSMTDKKERDQSVKDFLSGKIRIMINVLIFSVGFDYPALDCIIDATPTASVVRWYQKWGRGCRIYFKNAFKTCLILDFANSNKRFGRLESLTFEDDPIHGWSMFSGDNLLTNMSISEIGSVKKSGKDIQKGECFTFGKWKGKNVSDIPNDYLHWALANLDWTENLSELKKSIIKELSKTNEKNY